MDFKHTTDDRCAKRSGYLLSDALFRSDLHTISKATSLSWSGNTKAQENSDEIIYLQSLLFCLKLKGIALLDADGLMDFDTSIRKPRQLVHCLICCMMFTHLNFIPHPGVRGFLKLISECYAWPNMNRESRVWAKAYIPCQKSKTQRHAQTSSRIPTEKGLFSHIHIDLVSLLPPVHDHRFFPNGVDRSTR